MSLLRVENLAIDLVRDGVSHRLVRDVSLSVDAGETVAIVGESGSGKSLTALAIMGLLTDELRIDQGRILFDRRDLAKLDPDKAMRYAAAPPSHLSPGIAALPGQ